MGYVCIGLAAVGNVGTLLWLGGPLGGAWDEFKLQQASVSLAPWKLVC
jgi:hypothetical protein